MELLPNNTINFSRNQAILTYSESYWQTILHTFPELTSNNTDIFRKLLENNTTHFSRVYIKQHWYFQRVPSKLNYIKKFFQSSYHTILTLLESYYQTISTYLELISNTLTELLTNSGKHFFEIQWTLEQTENSRRKNSQVKVRKVSLETRSK